MSASSIEWTDETWNPVVGCTPVSPGCLNCYAAVMARRLEAMGKPEYAPRVEKATMGTPYDKGDPERTIRIAEVRGGRAVFTGEVRCLDDRLTLPLRWKKGRRVFVNSMSDLFHEGVPFEFVDRVFAVMSTCPQHQFQVLTKRADRMVEYIRYLKGPGAITWAGKSTGYEHIRTIVQTSEHTPMKGLKIVWPLPNVTLGVSVENQECADKRVPALVKLARMGWKTFISQEPQIGPVVYRDEWAPAIGLIIVGGESGQSLDEVRPFNIAWARQTRDWCAKHGVPFYQKQLGAKPLLDDNSTAALTRQWLADGMSGRHYTGNGSGDFYLHLKSRKGSDPAEWPEDLRIRQEPRGVVKEDVSCG